MRLKVVAASAGIASIVLAMSAVATKAQPLSATSGVFTAAQVERGQTAYAAQCARCHGADLDAVDPEAPDLTGFSFRQQWVGQTIGARFDEIKATMPMGNPGGLDDQTYLDVIAFILSSNGYPAGSAELTTAVDLTAIQITAP